MIDRISSSDREYLNLLRGISISRVVLVHLGLSWFFSPYSEFIHCFLPILFFVSGAVTYFSYLRRKTTVEYLKNRLISLLVPYYLVILISFVGHWLINLQMPSFDLEYFLYWISVNPVPIHETMPYPLGQVWYLHTIFIILLISPVIFKITENNPIYFLLFIAISISVTVIQLFNDIGKDIFIFGHNLYQPLSNICFFLMGSFFYRFRGIFTERFSFALAIMSLLIGIIIYYSINTELAISAHTYSPDLYYVSLSFSSIFITLSLKKYLSNIIHKIPYFFSFFMFMSRNSYSVFLLHSLPLYLIHHIFEVYIDLPFIIEITIKIFLTFFITCLISVPITRVSNTVIDGIKSNKLSYFLALNLKNRVAK